MLMALTDYKVDKVYTVGAAGFWLQRWREEEKRRQDAQLAGLVLKLTRRNLRQIERVTALATGTERPQS